jgi:hypothetical protein
MTAWQSKVVNVAIAASALAVAAWLQMPATVPATVVVAPAAPPVPVVTTEPVAVYVFDAAGKRAAHDVEVAAGKMPVGSWRVQGVPKEGEAGWWRTIVVTEDGKPIPPPLPPSPGPKPPEPPPGPTLPATAVTYVYEKDTTPIPSAVMAGLNRLNREKKLLATLHEIDTTDGTSEIPDQYKVAVAAAKEAGLPALVVTAGSVVVKVVKAPTTVEQVWEAAL